MTRHPPPLARAYPAVRQADHAIKTAPPGRKLAMRKAKVRVVAECLKSELKERANV